MATFPLKIMTPDGVAFDGAVTSVSCRTINGQLQLLARHIDICTALGMGEAHIKMEDGHGPPRSLYGRYAEHAWRRVPSAGNDL